MENQLASQAADNMRILIAAMVEKSKSGHPGGAMGGADFTNLLYSEFLKWDPDNMSSPFRDRFFLDPGHMSPMLYSILSFTGRFDMEDLKSFRQWGSVTPGHPEIDIERGIENTSGPLGQGHAMGLGSAIAERMLRERFGNWLEHHTFSFISDGGVQEEISQGVGRIAGSLKLGNYIMFYDANNVQLSTKVSAVSIEDTGAKYRAWGWHVQEIDGNNPEEIRNALKNAISEKCAPSIIIGRTIMGKGCRGAEKESMEGLVSTHGQPISNAGVDINETIKNLGGNPENPFAIFPEVEKAYAEILDKKRAEAKEKNSKAEAWKKANPEEAIILEKYLENSFQELDFANIKQKENSPTRGASAVVLGELAKNIENVIVSSADLANSDKTDGFLKQTHPLTADDFSGRFLHAGVSELTMAAIMNGIALHGGFVAACGTFFVFSDYMKPVVRMSALQELPVKYIWSHDAFRVGEDGPTHQPIEQLAQIRLMELVYNHSKKRSMLVLRPADAFETNIAWQMAMENIATPTGLVLSRQNVEALPAMKNSTRVEDAKNAKKGAYIVNKDEGEIDITLVGSGSEVRTLYDAAQILREKSDIKIQIVSVISEGLFLDQTAEYKKETIPTEKPVFGLIAGLEESLKSLVGEKGYVHGLNHFGYSAPAKVLDEKFGFTPELVSINIEKYLKNNA